MGNRKEVLIIIPAYNEEKTIVPVLEKLEQPEIAQIADVLVMNDASSDATKHVTKKRKHDVVTHVFNLGYGSGLQLGYKYAVRKDYRYVIQMDADGQHDVCNIPKIYETLQTRDENGELPDIVLGSRFMEGSTDFPVSPAKKIAFAWFRTMLKLGTGRSISDPTTGLQGLSWRTFLFYSKYDNFDDKYPEKSVMHMPRMPSSSRRKPFSRLTLAPHQVAPQRLKPVITHHAPPSVMALSATSR